MPFVNSCTFNCGTGLVTKHILEHQGSSEIIVMKVDPHTFVILSVVCEEFCDNFNSVDWAFNRYLYGHNSHEFYNKIDGEFRKYAIIKPGSIQGPEIQAFILVKNIIYAEYNYEIFTPPSGPIESTYCNMVFLTGVATETESEVCNQYVASTEYSISVFYHQISENRAPLSKIFLSLSV